MSHKVNRLYRIEELHIEHISNIIKKYPEEGRKLMKKLKI